MNDNSVEFARLTGRDESELVQVGELRMHCRVRPDWQALCRTAAEAGFELAAVSAYRSFDRQLLIWNEKARGLRDVVDDAGAPVDIAALQPLEKLRAILRFSALPGASRHHWGSDFDVIDRAAIAPGYRVQLTHTECCGNGPFAALHEWLDTLIGQHRAFGFFRPYAERANDGEGVAPERWHLSHWPQASRMQALRSRDAMYAFYQNFEALELRQALLAHFDSVYRYYVCAETAY
ncbi:MAG: M15 family metallopeptidase [Pseudomonadales bacterium]